MAAGSKMKWQNLRFFMHDHWQAMTAIGAIAILIVAVGAWATRDLGEPTVTEAAEVVSFGSYDSKFGDRPVVVVRLSNGGTAQLGVSPGIVRGCRIGARIRIVRNGGTTRVAPEGCIRPTP